MSPEVSEKVDRFFNQYKLQTFKKGEILIPADQNPAGIFYLVTGQVKQYAVSQKGDNLTVNIFKPAAYFPMSWAINNSTNNFYFEALTEVEVRLAPPKDALAFVQNNPDVLFDLTKRLYSGLDGILTKMVFMMSGEATKRVLTELLISAKRFGQINPKDNSVSVKITEQELANQTGMARETISRELTKLKSKQLLLTQNKQIVIPSLAFLESELSAL